MISINLQNIEKIQNEFSDQIESYRIQALSNLKKISRKGLQKFEKEYLDWTITLLDNKGFLSLKPDSIDTLIIRCKNVPYRVKTDQKSKKKKRYISPLKDKILLALNYNGLRSNFYPIYFKKVGIKSCVYCNSMLTVAVDSTNSKGEKKTKAKFQLDHYYNKNEYPFLAISLFNLYPACASCNLAKGTKKVNFKLYIDDLNPESNFHFKLTPASKANFTLFRDPELLDFTFEEKGLIPKGFATFQSTFDIQGIYDTQKDVIEDLINKKLIYNETFQTQIIRNFPDLFRSNIDFQRFILGNHSNPSEIHKRPLSKFMQDIARDLELI